MKLLTSRMLRGACEEQRRKFRELFPDGAPVTVRAAMRAHRAGLDVLWCVGLLPAPLDEQYLAARKPLYDQYWAACKPLDDQYLAACKPLDDQYWAALKPLDDQYRAALKPLYDQYLAARIRLLVSMLRKA